MSWNTFENNVKDALLGRFNDNSEESEGPNVELLRIAETITNEYHSVVIKSKESIAGISRGFTPPGINLLEGAMLGIQGAIFAALKTMQLSNIKPNMAILSPIGSAVVAYWSAVMVPGAIAPTPMPVAPPYLSPAPGSNITFPGNPAPVINGFKKALTLNYDDSGNITAEEGAANAAKDLREGFENHMKTVSGIYVGIVQVGLVPTPTPTPWLGMKP
jgi:hypothetical protein